MRPSANKFTKNQHTNPRRMFFPLCSVRCTGTSITLEGDVSQAGRSISNFIWRLSIIAPFRILCLLQIVPPVQNCRQLQCNPLASHNFSSEMLKTFLVRRTENANRILWSVYCRMFRLEFSFTTCRSHLPKCPYFFCISICVKLCFHVQCKSLLCLWWQKYG